MRCRFKFQTDDVTGKFDTGTAAVVRSISRILCRQQPARAILIRSVTYACNIQLYVQYPERTSLTLPKLRSSMYPTPFFLHRPIICCCPSSSSSSSFRQTSLWVGKCKVAISPKSNARRQTMITETATEDSHWCTAAGCTAGCGAAALRHSGCCGVRRDFV